MQSNGFPRVVISGLGVVSPFGAGRDCFWRNVSRGVSGTRAITHFDASSYPCRVAASVPPVSIEAAAPIALIVAGVSLGITAIVTGAIGLKRDKPGFAIAGLSLGITGVLAAIIYAVWVAVAIITFFSL